jgi:uncharacterized RDD family membrane protein YckC
MHQSLRFETPENVTVEYRAAGLGTRFVAWFVDQLILWLFMFVVFIVLLVVGASFDETLKGLRAQSDGRPDRAMMYLMGFMALIWGLGSFVYFGGSELFMRGQTLGKRTLGIRVVKANGFQLDATSILLRNLFRVLDHLPPMWLVPLLSRLSQRAGDLVAGTVVIADGGGQISEIRSQLSARRNEEAQFRFDQRQLGRLTSEDYAAIEQLLEREASLPEVQRSWLIETCVRRVAKKLGVEAPPVEAHLQFLRDLFAAELRRQERKLV